MKNHRFVNFCHPKLCSTVSCNTCCSENYEETNLLSPDPAKLRRGFMADRFIKPPVEIQITFKYPVNLCSIMLFPRVGQQKSSGFEVMANFSDGTSAKTERIGSCYLSERDEGVLFFCPRKFGKGKPNHHSSEQQNFLKRSFTWQKMSAISDVQSVIIRIVRTISSSVPALGKIEIWGKPGFHTTIQEKEEIRRLWEQQYDETKLTRLEVSEMSVPSQVAGTSKESTSTARAVNIPEEFLDGLTFEMMSLPMVLPSGKVIDQKTLERHQDSEANWGRHPSDPFTGRPFTATLHPILDTALKSRIDRFLVEHQDKDELRSVPRTLGRKKNPSIIVENEVYTSLQTQEAKPMKLKSHNDQLCSSSCQNHNIPQSSVCVKNVSSEHGRKSPKNISLTTISKTPVETKSTKRAFSPEVTIISKNISSRKSLKVESNRHMSVENTVRPVSTSRPQTDDDLDDALKAVLKGLPSFVNTDITQQIKLENCCNCGSTDNLFKLPCKHLVCRVCLLEKTRSARPSCYRCQFNFTSDQPERYHAAD